MRRRTPLSPAASLAAIVVAASVVAATTLTCEPRSSVHASLEAVVATAVREWDREDLRNARQDCRDREVRTCYARSALPSHVTALPDDSLSLALARRLGLLITATADSTPPDCGDRGERARMSTSRLALARDSVAVTIHFICSDRQDGRLYESEHGFQSIAVRREDVWMVVRTVLFTS